MIYIITGAIESGKTKALNDWAKDRDDVYGILTPNNELGSRYLMDLSTQERYPMQAKTQDNMTISVGRYHFYRSAFTKGDHIIEEALSSMEKGYIVIDELGKLELKNKGFYKVARSVIDATQNNPNLHSVLVIRSYLLEDMKDHFDIMRSELMDLKQQPTPIGNSVT